MASALSLPRLHRAAACGEETRLSQFLLAGDDVNFRDARGRTRFFCAVYNGFHRCVELLLAAGADPSIGDNDNWFPLLIAAQHKNIAIATALIQANADVNAIINRPDGGTALGMAAFLGDQAMVRLLLNAGCDTSKTSVHGSHPLTIASLGGHAEVVGILLAGGADVSAVDSDGMHALLCAAQKGSCGVIRRLLEGGANAEQATPEGRTALHMAAQHGFDGVIKVLIAAGAGVDQTDCHAATPLQVAAFHGEAKCAMALLRAGANVSARDLQGSSPLHTAAFKGFTDVIEVLLSAGAHADVNLEDKANHTPLVAASAFADVKAVNLLLDAGAEINQRDALGRTALFATSDLKIVKALLDRGANATLLLHNFGSTVLHSAGARGACAGVICALFKAGADPTIKTKEGETAADWARHEGHEDAAKLLDLLEAKHRAMINAWIRDMVLELVP